MSRYFSRSSRSSLAAFAALLSCGTAMADQEAPNPDVAGFGRRGQEEIVVTATRSPQRLDHIGNAVTLLDQKAIDASQAISLSELLVQTPGVTFSRNGGTGTSTSVRIRGAESDHTVVLIDGVKLNDPSSTGGGFNFANLMVGDIARVEILRGPQSTLWGGQAIGGVVGIVTRQPTKPFEASLDVEGGSQGTGYVRGGVGGTSNQVGDLRVTWRAAGGYFRTTGVSAYSGGTELDGYRNTGANGELRIEANPNLSVDLRAVYSSGRNEFDGTRADSLDYGKTKELVAYAGLNFNLIDGRWKNRVAYAYTDTDRDNFNPARTAVPRTFDAAGRNKRAEYQGTFAFTEQLRAVFGAETERSDFRTASPSVAVPDPVPGKNHVKIDSVYGQLQAEPLAGLTLTGGVRHDSHDRFGGHTVGQAAAAWSLNNGDTVLRASWGQGFKAPTLYQMFSEYGNRNLAPETANGWDVGVEQKLLDRAVTVSAAYFGRKAKDQIDFISCPLPGQPLCADGRFGFYENIARSKAHGVELVGVARIGEALTLKANYTWTKTENRSVGNANFGKDLTRRPVHAANAEATYLWPSALSTTVAVRYAAGAYDDAANTFRLDAYTLVDFRVSYPVSETIELYGRVENLFDEQYQTVRYYGTLGRGVFGGVRARF